MSQPKVTPSHHDDIPTTIDFIFLADYDYCTKWYQSNRMRPLVMLGISLSVVDSLLLAATLATASAS